MTDPRTLKPKRLLLISVAMCLLLTTSLMAAIDTPEERRAAATVHTWWSVPGKTPSALHDLEWRQQSVFTYSGIGAGGPTPKGLLYWLLREDAK